MRALAFKKTRALLATVMATASLAVATSTALAAPVSFDLCAVTGSVTMPDSTVIPIWGFGAPTTPGNCSTATATLPGPQLTVNEGDTVTIHVINALPAATAPLHSISLEIPGVTFDATSVPGAAVGATATVSFTAGAPGAYLYQSGGDAGRQEAMGLYGALIVRSSTAGQAYDTPTTAYDVEAVLVLSQLDPLFNASPDSADMYQYLATYWLVNGQPYSVASPGITAAAGQRVLLRYLNAGYDNTSMVLLGMHEQVLARDAHLLNNPFLADAETIPAGGRTDAIATVPSGAAPSANGFALYNRQLHVGMMTFIHP